MNKAITMKKTIRDDDGRDLLRIASDTLPDAGHKAIEAFYTKSDRDFQQSCEKLLLPRAKRDSADERFKPFGAVRRLTIACDKPFVYLLPRGTLRERELFKSTTF